MTSGIFAAIPIDEVSIGERQRKNRKELDRLKRSILRRGLIHPIVIDRDNCLIAGAGRLTVCKELGWTSISCQFVEDLSEDDREMLELEENTVRENLTWEEQHEQYARRIQAWKKRNPEITLEALGEELNLDKASVSRHILYEENKYEPAVQQAARNGGFGTAVNAAVRVKERRVSDALHIVAPHNNTHSPIVTMSFHVWAPAYRGPKFNLIHCDFPYGIEAHKHAGQNSSLEVGYDDSAKVYWQLFKSLAVHLDGFCAESAHMVFWFSPNVYCATWEYLKLLEGFRFDEHPLIWQRGENEGIAPDPARRPRRVYEMAFFGWRGDRKIIRTKANSVVAPTERSRHPHEKSEAALIHFFEMCVDGNTRLFDPTCGSGSALRAARALGAAETLGLELNEEYAETARRSLDAIS